jgi:hypothetical protein
VEGTGRTELLMPTTSVLVTVTWKLGVRRVTGNSPAAIPFCTPFNRLLTWLERTVEEGMGQSNHIVCIVINADCNLSSCDSLSAITYRFVYRILSGVTSTRVV